MTYLASSTNRRRSQLGSTFLLALLALLLLASTVQAGDWDGDFIDDTQDWGVVLTFDMHPTWEPYWEWTDWTTGKNIMATLADHNAKGTFFISGFAKVATDANWKSLVHEAVWRGNELAWHTKDHTVYSPSIGPAPYVNSQIFCDAGNYNVAAAGMGWPTDLWTFAYPNTAGDNLVDGILQWWVRHARGSGAGAVGPLIPTSAVGSYFRLGGLWLDNSLLVNGNLYDVKHKINTAFFTKQVVILAAHSFTNMSPTNLKDVLNHVNCLNTGGYIYNGFDCTGGTGYSTNTVFHRFDEIPSYQPWLTSIATSSTCSP